MKVHTILLLFCAATLAAIGSGVILSSHRQMAVTRSASEQLFEVKGRVRGLEMDDHTVRIAHEDIPGFMPAMEMPFHVKDPALLRGLEPGDVVRFQLRVTSDDSWVTQISKLETGGVLEAAPPALAPAPTVQRVETGQQIPDFSLTDQHGRVIHLDDFKGKALLLTFVYTRCPLPNYCPLMSKNFASLQERFSRSCPGRVQLLSVSFDPEFDTPEVLRRYAALYQHDDTNWLFACGTRAEVDRVTDLFGLVKEPANGFINHDLRTALISPAGKLVHVWRSNVWTPFEVERMVRETLGGNFARK